MPIDKINEEWELKNEQQGRNEEKENRGARRQIERVCFGVVLNENTVGNNMDLADALLV